MAQSTTDGVNHSCVPQVGLRFRNIDEAWSFWVSYSGQAGFEVRIRYKNKSSMDGKVTSCKYGCAKEGHRARDNRDRVIKNPRAETRTGCNVHMSLTVDRVVGDYKVSEVVLVHNHNLYLPQTFHLMVSQRKISEMQAFEIETADDSGIMPKAAHEYASRQVGGPMHLSYTSRDHKNHLQGKRQRDLAYGQAGSMLKYFQDKIAENPSFQYALQLDCEERIANIFWADAKMIIDYAQFGDVVTFDTTFGTNKEYRPFGVFVGFNHFRETIIFGAAILFDETCASFTWLFEAFLAAHNGKQPRTIYTDQDTAMGNAVEKVFTEAWHGLCTFHIMQNAIKRLCHVKESPPLKGKRKKVEKKNNDEEEPHILSNFSACMYEIEEKAAFEEAFDVMRNKVDKKTWFDSIYKFKEKWAECYMRDVFSLGMRSTQLSESFNSDLKKHLKSDFDILRFLKHFERAVQGKRNKELDAEFEARKKILRVRMKTPMLVQTSKLYTNTIFEVFQTQYERSMSAYTRVLDGNNTYAVAIGSGDDGLAFVEKERIVVGNPLEQTTICSCGLFTRTGILCYHALKVLDLMNIKLLPTYYILKRWTREARCGTILDNQGRSIVENPKLDAMLRYRFLSHKFFNLAYQAASSQECCLLVDNALDCLGKVLENKLNASSSILSDSHDAQQDGVSLIDARLKKKEVQLKSSKRKRSWVEKLRKFRKEVPNTSSQKEDDGVVETQVAMDKDELQEFDDMDSIISYTNLLTGHSQMDHFPLEDLI